MNKKFSTLMATALIAGTMSVYAMDETPIRPYEFRKADVTAEASMKTISQIDGDKWYQLSTSTYYKDDFRMHGHPYKKSEVLVHYRDGVTGKVYLRLVPAEEAPLVPSLWRLTYKEDQSGRRAWVFVNKETGIELSFDPAFANDKLYRYSAESKVMVRNNCTIGWEWYNTNSHADGSAFEEVAPYAVVNNDTVMIMRRGANGYVYSHKGKRSELIANDQAKDVYALTIRPVEAAPLTLNEYSFNSMIDANKPSADQEGYFNFFEPNGNLLNPKEMNPETGGVMTKTSPYIAEEDESAIFDFYNYSVEQFDGTTDPKEFYEALTKVISTKKGLIGAEMTLGDVLNKYIVADGNYNNLLGQQKELEEGKAKMNVRKLPINRFYV